MYKRQLKSWNYHKNIHKEDMTAMANIKNWREAAGKGTVFYISGKQINLTQRLEGHETLVSAFAEMASNGAQSTLPPYITYRTPSPQPYQLKLPDHLQLKEITLRWSNEQDIVATAGLSSSSIRAYHQGLRLPEKHYLRRLSAAAIQGLESMEVSAHTKALSDAMCVVVSENPVRIFPPAFKHQWHAPYPGSPAALKFQSLDNWSTEAIIEADFGESISFLDAISYRIALLTCWGRRDGWDVDDIYRTALALLRLVEDKDDSTQLLLRRQYCLVIIALHHRARFDANPEKNNPRLRLAIVYLELAVDLDREYSNVSFDLQDQVQMLRLWYEEVGDLEGAKRCREFQERYEKCLREQVGEAEIL
ncbi:hypothetical protein G7054_g7328 [Neopestalotiopsis clavispora]|nr:hypothetical protein G7054_g7328 [Neopestalotiopsis clavispora]